MGLGMSELIIILVLVLFFYGGKKSRRRSGASPDRRETLTGSLEPIPTRRVRFLSLEKSFRGELTRCLESDFPSSS